MFVAFWWHARRSQESCCGLPSPSIKHHASYNVQDAAAHAFAPAGTGGPTAGEKKRKRGPPSLEAGWSEEQLAGLQELFGRDEYASTADKTALAAHIGLELAQVGWGEELLWTEGCNILQCSLRCNNLL